MMTTTLKFYAKTDQLVTVPGSGGFTAQPPSYVGRQYTQLGVDAKERKVFGFPATERAFECQSDSAVGMRLRKLIQRDESLWAADRTTATACGVTFVDVELMNGEWVKASRKQKKKPTDGRIVDG